MGQNTIDRNVIRIQGMIDGQPSTLDGEYIVDYDPSRTGITVGWMNFHLVTTPEKARATRYTKVEAMELWRRVDQRHPVRSTDGKPNRPLTAFSVEIFPEDQEPKMPTNTELARQE